MGLWGFCAWLCFLSSTLFAKSHSLNLSQSDKYQYSLGIGGCIIPPLVSIFPLFKTAKHSITLQGPDRQHSRVYLLLVLKGRNFLRHMVSCVLPCNTICTNILNTPRTMIVFQSPIANKGKNWQLNQTATDLDWTAVASPARGSSIHVVLSRPCPTPDSYLVTPVASQHCSSTLDLCALLQSRTRTLPFR